MSFGVDQHSPFLCRFCSCECSEQVHLTYNMTLNFWSAFKLSVYECTAMRFMLQPVCLCVCNISIYIWYIWLQSARGKNWNHIVRAKCALSTLRGGDNHSLITVRCQTSKECTVHPSRIIIILIVSLDSLAEIKRVTLKATKRKLKQNLIGMSIPEIASSCCWTDEYQSALGYHDSYRM